MALFKVFRGIESDLQKVPFNEGYGYFIPNTFDYDTDDEEHLGGKLFFDVKDNKDGTLARFQVDAQVAKGLLVEGEFISGDQFALVNDLTDIIRSDNNLSGVVFGDGSRKVSAKQFANNSLLLGSSNDVIKEITPSNNAILLGSESDGIKQIVISDKMFIIGDKTEGIKAVNSETARTTMSVYSKQESDQRTNVATTVAYEATLLSNGWEEKLNDSGDTIYEQIISAQLRCGAANNVPPLITLNSSNVDDYARIISAMANVGENIVFTASSLPERDISLIIIDNA